MSLLSKIVPKQNKEPIDASHIEVVLKDYAGLKPQQYLKIAYALVLALVLFGLLVLPGLLHYGSKVNFNSWPQDVAVYVDGQRIGATPFTAFIKAGNHLVTYHKPFYQDIDQEMNVNGRLFFSLFLPKRMKTEQTMVLDDLDSLLKQSFSETSKWVQIPERSAFPRPTLLLNTAQDLISQWDSLKEAQKTLILRWAGDIYALSSDETSFSEIRLVWQKLKEVGLPIDLSFVTAKDFKDRNPSFANLLSELATENLEDGNLVLNNEVIKPNITLSGNNFRYVAGGNYVMGNSDEFNRRANYEYYPHKVTLQGFYYMPSLVLEQQVAILPTPISGNAPYARASIPNQSAKYITLELAQSYVQYLNQVLNQNGRTDLMARLITEAEWEYLARQNLINIDGYEWTGDSYFTYRYLLYPNANTLYSPFNSATNVIRGYATEVNQLMPINMRGSAMTDDASPYVGFRVVLVNRGF